MVVENPAKCRSIRVVGQTRLETKMDEGLKIWQEWFEWSGDPWVDDDYGNTDCFFCGEDKPSHMPSCVFVKAQALCLPNNACNRPASAVGMQSESDESAGN